MAKASPKLGRPVREAGVRPTQERILDAAIDLFSRKGYAGSSIRDIAREVGLSEGALYKHYASKEALLDAVLGHFDAKIFGPMPSEDPRASIFRVLMGGLPAYFEANPRVMKIGRVLLNEAGVNPRIGEYLSQAMGERAKEAVTAIFEAEIASGRLVCADPPSLAALFNDLRFGWVYKIQLRGESAVGGEMIQELEGIIRVLEDKFCKGGIG